jgi:hypothetical protein
MDAADGGINKIAYKKKAFTSILDSEEKHLRHSQALIEGLRCCIAAIEA